MNRNRCVHEIINIAHFKHDSRWCGTEQLHGLRTEINDPLPMQISCQIYQRWRDLHVSRYRSDANQILWTFCIDVIVAEVVGRKFARF
jgi:hypothetical protein